MAATSDQSGLGWLVKHMFPLFIINVCVPLSPGFTVSRWMEVVDCGRSVNRSADVAHPSTVPAKRLIPFHVPPPSV